MAAAAARLRIHLAHHTGAGHCASRTGGRRTGAGRADRRGAPSARARRLIARVENVVITEPF
jgi:hypothetical protein